MRVDVWSDVVCPWCYLGSRRLARAVEAFSGPGPVDVVHHAFQLDPERPPGETEPQLDVLVAKYGADPAQIRARWADLERLGAAEGITYRFEGGLAGNTFDAHRVVRLALDHGRQAAVLERLFRAHFSEQRSVFEPGSLAQLAGEAGLDPVEVAEVLAGDRYRAEVAQAEAAARELGVTGVPFVVVGGRYGVSGAQPVEVLAEAFARAARDAPAR